MCDHPPDLTDEQIDAIRQVEAMLGDGDAGRQERSDAALKLTETFGLPTKLRYEDEDEDENPTLIGATRVKFSERNRRRCESALGFRHRLDSWSLSDWMTAAAGELGEAANVIKKLNRVRDGISGNTATPTELREQLAEELADVAIYLDLLAQAAGFDLETIREAKFVKTSAKLGYKEP
jgi:NTP pyrophosphatase (non-canonical NTP hydrolase)